MSPKIDPLLEVTRFRIFRPNTSSTSKGVNCLCFSHCVNVLSFITETSHVNVEYETLMLHMPDLSNPHFLTKHVPISKSYPNL